MDIQSWNWDLILKWCLTVFTTLRILWFVRRQKSWELLILCFTATVIFALNLNQKNEFLNLNIYFESGIYILAWILTVEPELYRAFYYLEQSTKSNKGLLGKMVDELISGAELLSQTKTGALIAFERNDNLNKLAQSGTAINSDVKKELLTAIFSKEALTHDGGAIIRKGKMTHVSTIFPLTFSLEIDKNLGTRHRAAIGLTEQTDAVCLIVSEEEGTISLAENGKIHYNLDSKALRKNLMKWLTAGKFKKIYPFHQIRSLRVVEKSPAFLRFLKSFSLQTYDIAFVIFYLFFILNWMLAKGETIQSESIQNFFLPVFLSAEPWRFIPLFLLGSHLIFTIIQPHVTFNQTNSIFLKQNDFLFVPIWKIQKSFTECQRVFVKRESQKASLWTFFLEDKKGKKICLDVSGFPNSLLADAKQVQEVAKIELVNQS